MLLIVYQNNWVGILIGLILTELIVDYYVRTYILITYVYLLKTVLHSAS